MVNPFQPFPQLETARFRIRQLLSSDAEVLFGYFSLPEVTRYFGIEPFTSRSEAEGFIRQYAEAIEQGRGIRWGVTDTETGRLLGTCGFHGWVKPHRRAEIGYELMPEVWRHGIMSEVLPVILDWGFAHMRLHRVSALISLENRASIRLVEKLGFQREGVLRAHAWTGGQPEDLISYSLLSHELVLAPQIAT